MSNIKKITVETDKSISRQDVISSFSSYAMFINYIYIIEHTNNTTYWAIVFKPNCDADLVKFRYIIDELKYKNREGSK